MSTMKLHPGSAASANLTDRDVGPNRPSAYADGPTAIMTGTPLFGSSTFDPNPFYSPIMSQICTGPLECIGHACPRIALSNR
jgi:hypothetical protein